MGEKFPVIAEENCVNIVYNSIPYYMADKQDGTDSAAHTLYQFTVETSAEVVDVIRAYEERLPGNGRRI
jgi:hypothetical protein